MTDHEARDLVLTGIADVVPGADVAALPGDAVLRDELDMDSMDALSLLEELAAAMGRDIPDRDAAALHTVDDLVANVVAHTVPAGA